MGMGRLAEELGLSYRFIFMRILIADTIFPKGHCCLNKHLLEILFKNEKVTEMVIFNYKDYYAIHSNKVINYNVPFLLRSKKAYIDYVCQFFNSLLIAFLSLRIRYDKVIFFTFDTLSFSFLRLIICKPIYLFHHNNTDHLQNKYKLMLFKTYMNKVNHMVFADFIKDYLISIGVNSNRIYVISHPLPAPSLKGEKVKMSNIYIALGHANDENIICNLIEYEKQKHCLEKNNIRLILRTRNVYDKLPLSINIVTGFLTEEQYRDYYKEAKGVLILYSDYFKYRFSGVLLDALVARKKIIGRDIPIVKYYAQMYPSCCYSFKGIDDLMKKIVIDSTTPNVGEEIYNSFFKAHSDQIIASQLNEILL